MLLKVYFLRLLIGQYMIYTEKISRGHISILCRAVLIRHPNSPPLFGCLFESHTPFVTFVNCLTQVLSFAGTCISYLCYPVTLIIFHYFHDLCYVLLFFAVLLHDPTSPPMVTVGLYTQCASCTATACVCYVLSCKFTFRMS